MGRRAQVCGAPTAIALDAERVGSGWRRGCVLHTTENTVVLRSGENSLQALDAQRFCAGSVDVRHVVELPRSVTFSKRNWGGNYGVAWGNKRDDDGESSGAVYIVDCQAGEVTARAVPDLNEQVADAFLDLNGEQVAAVGATTGKLYCWSRSNWDHRGSLEATSRSEWRVVDGVAVDTAAPVDLCSRGRFMSSAVMGNCFVYLRARRDTSGSAIVEKWLFDVDARWTPVIISSRTMGASASDADSAEGLALFMTEKWKSVVLTVGSTLYHFQVDQDLRNSSVKRLALDHRVLDGAWVHQDAAFAMLLANGQISIANISDTGTFELLAITTSSTISKRLSLSALLGKAVSAALQLAWVAQEKQLVVDFGSSCAAFELEIVADESSSSICDDSNNSIELLGSRALAQSNRRIITRLDKKFSEFDDCIHDLLEGKSSPSSNDLLDVAKIALTQNHRDFEDLYFTLLRLIHQQLAGDSVNNGNSRDPIDCIGKTTEIETSSNDVLKVNNLHWQACEAYIGETMTILRRIGARRQFKYSNREAECNIGRISVAIGADFDDYHRSLSAELARTTGKTHCAASSMNTLWEFSHLDKRLRARVICLISRIVWHLEAASEDVGSLFQRAFVLNLFDAQMESFAEEHDKLHVCITKMRAIINPEETELRLPRFRKPEEVQPGLSLRSQKIARSLVLMAWALWLREKAADCSRGAHIVKMKGETNETEMLGALAATCALHLNALGKVYGANEEHLSIQLSLLEDAAVMNPSKTAAVIAWGFPAQKILTRHLKRYNVLRQVIQHSSRSMSVEECEQHFQKLQKHMRRAFHRSRDNLQNAEPTHNENSDIDVLVDCCCDPECLQIMSVVTKYPFKVVATSTSVPGRSHPLRTPEVVSQEDLRDNVEQLLPSTDPDQTPISTTGQVLLEPQISISRDEVIALLQAQTRHLEEKIHAVTVVGKSRPSSSYEDGHDAGIEKTVPTLDQGKQRSTSEKRVDTTGEDVVALADVQRMARISLQVRDLSRHRYSSAVSEVENQTNPLAKPSHRHNSVRNALKLFRLRQENCGHTSSEPGGSKTANENGTPNTAKSVNPTLDIETSHDNRSPAAVMSRREKLKRAGIKKSSRNQRSSESPSFPAKEPVYSLRLEYGIDNASLKLLGRNSEQRNPSVRRKQFVHQERERLPKAYARTSAAINATVVESAQVIQLKTISAQTNDPIEDDVSPVSAAKETKDIGPEKRSPMTQECDVAHCSVAVNTSNSQKSKGIQCGVPENGPTNSGRRKQGPPPLSIADKYPIWVDLDEANNVGSRSHFKERKKFLQVARFGSPNASDATANNDASDNSAHTTMLPSVSTVLVPRKVNSDDGSDENQSDGQHSPSLSNSQAHEDDTLEQIGDSMKTRYRARYRQQYPVQERPSSRKSDDREGASAINSLIDLRDNMQRMTQRLRVLETCANSIDEEFKVSQKRLSQIGDMRPDDISSQERVLADIDEVLKMTEDASSQASARKPREGLLSKKASSDFDAAKYASTLQRISLTYHSFIAN
ncbi:hypothetical protein PHYPSEUDO_012830 [Phytophthora pseudosyringae]|uniref:Uncharacterized protein n=1 Tax=Phytophthora pseudosyringae TaxID=221518 RepID=A0A8T1W7X2_9STRA|nr:hypothetical protein PHYPSEUDO_012830 [Phytophthora pseudosyringae]